MHIIYHPAYFICKKIIKLNTPYNNTRYQLYCSLCYIDSTLAESSNSASAESVAIALLKRFSEKQLPKASELEWLVSEQDAPQRVSQQFI